MCIYPFTYFELCVFYFIISIDEVAKVVNSLYPLETPPSPIFLALEPYKSLFFFPLSGFIIRENILSILPHGIVVSFTSMHSTGTVYVIEIGPSCVSLKLSLIATILALKKANCLYSCTYG